MMSDNEIKDISENCFVCSNEILPEKFIYNDVGWSLNPLFAKLSILHCKNCGVGFVKPEPPIEAINSYYENQYRSKLSTFHINFDAVLKPGISDIRNDRAFSQISQGREYCDFKDNDIFLDIGPGAGGSFGIMKALFPKARLSAIELSEKAKNYYNINFNAETYPSIENFISKGNLAKIILMSHSLEHFRRVDLPQLFSGIKKALDQNGIVIVEVPNVDMAIHNDVRGPDTPHLLFFTERSLKKLFISNGFDCLFIDTYGTYYSNQSESPTVTDSQKYKFKLRMLFNKLPLVFQGFLRSLVRSVRKMKSIVSRIFKNRDPNQIELPYHSFGGNRTALRLIAKKSIIG